MAEPALFDITLIDLDQVALPADEVGRYNPQVGPMRMLDHVIWVAEDGNQGLGVRKVRDDEFWVECHIPGRPLMPGVLMIEAAAQLCSVLQHLKNPGAHPFLGFTRCDDVAFRGQVVPGDVLYLLAEEIKSGRRRFVSRSQGVVNGQIVFGATITGMSM